MQMCLRRSQMSRVAQTLGRCRRQQEVWVHYSSTGTYDYQHISAESKDAAPNAHLQASPRKWSTSSSSPRFKSHRKCTAFHHFHPLTLQENNHGPYDVIDGKTCLALNFMDSDKLPSERCVEAGYFPAPSHASKPALKDLEVVERSAAMKLMGHVSIDATNDKATPAGSDLCTSRRAPEEREVE